MGPPFRFESRKATRGDAMDESGTGFGADLEHSDDLQAFSEWLDVSAEQHASHDSSLVKMFGTELCRSLASQAAI